MIAQKQCSKCKEWKDPSEFGKHKKTKDGLGSWCKECRKVYSRGWAREHVASQVASQRERRRANPEKAREVVKKWRTDNPQKTRELAKGYRQRHPDVVRARLRRWQINNPDKVNEHRQKRRAAKIGNGGNFTSEEWANLKRFYDFKCLCCGRKEPEIKLTIDHVVPLVLGGGNTIDNIQPLCASCNSRKGPKHIDFRKNPLNDG